MGPGNEGEMDRNELLRLKGFYENELTNRILAFWLPRCEDREYGLSLIHI